MVVKINIVDRRNMISPLIEKNNVTKLSNIIAERVIRKINENLRNTLNERRVVTFNGTTYPNNGWCVVLSGGSGSGKGYTLLRQLPIDGKIIDVDRLKELYVKMNGGYIEGEKYDSKNPEHVSKVHKEVKSKKWKDKIINLLLNSEAHRRDMLPNIIFDMTAKTPKTDVIEVVSKTKELGYKNVLVWVVCNRSEAIIRNIQRPRSVSDKVLHDIHNQLSANMPEFLNNALSTRYIDEAWIIFSSTDDIHRPSFSDEEKKDVAVRLNRTENGFEIDEVTEKRLLNILGPSEPNPENLEKYVKSDDVLKNYGEEETKTEVRPNWTDLSKPRKVKTTGVRINRSRIPQGSLVKNRQ